MDQNRSETNQSTQQQQQQQPQTVHLHMHHFCNCPGCLFQAYYHPSAAASVGYRSTLPSLLPYHSSPSTVSTRPYLQHYQYTQFNMGNQYTLPALNSVTAAAATAPTTNLSIFGQPTSNALIDLVCGRNRRGGTSSIGIGNSSGGGAAVCTSGSIGGGERCEEIINGNTDGRNGIGNLDSGNFDGDSANELILTNASDITLKENFVKFLERSCIIGEQVAQRNRNRPCFRNIQNLCVRTRSEILKQNTTVANIHSQGLPWATKDFIYAFIRLVNCWHILNGYWENKDEASLGNINKQLSPEFRACYIIWEKYTIEMATHLSRMFYNLDCDLNVGSGGAGSAAAAVTVSAATAAASYASALASPQINLMKSASESAIKKSSVLLTSSLDISSPIYASPPTRGLIHVQPPPPPPTIPSLVVKCNPIQKNPIQNDSQQQMQHNAVKEDECDAEEERFDRRVDLKPDANCVLARKHVQISDAYSSRGIEFLGTAKNVNKAMDMSAGRSEWEQDIIDNLDEYPEKSQSPPSAFLLASSLNNKPRDVKPYSFDAYDVLPELDDSGSSVLMKSHNATLPVLQREKFTRLILSNHPISKNQHCLTVNENDESPCQNGNPYEYRTGGLTDVGQRVLKNVIANLKSYILDGDMIIKKTDFESILYKITNDGYVYLKEAIHDLKVLVKTVDQDLNHRSDWLKEKLEIILMENFSPYNFNEINGDENDSIGPMKCSPIFNNNDYDEFI